MFQRFHRGETSKPLNKFSLMKHKKRVATRYAQNEEHLEILRELLNLEDTQLTDEESDNSTDLEHFDFTL